jgi:hypothetical protein
LTNVPQCGCQINKKSEEVHNQEDLKQRMPIEADEVVGGLGAACFSIEGKGIWAYIQPP